MWLPPSKADKRPRALFLLLPNPRPHPDPDLGCSGSFTAQGPWWRQDPEARLRLGQGDRVPSVRIFC